MWGRYKRWIVIIALSIGSFYLVRALLYEQYEASILDLDSRYSYLNDNPLDLTLFRQVLESRYQKVTLIADNDIERTVEETSSLDRSLYIFFYEYYTSGSWLEQVKAITERGSDVLIISDASVLLEEDLYASFEEIKEDKLNVSFGGQRVDYEPPVVEGLGRQYFGNISIPQSYQDKVRRVSEVRYPYSKLVQSYDEADSTVVDTTYVQLRYENGTLALDGLPFYYTNLAAREDIYYSHLVHTMGDYDVDAVYLVKANFLGDIPPSGPLAYVTQYQGPNLAILLMILITLLYLFNGRRRERAVPLLTPVHNTTMEFVDTVSRLYMSRDAGGMIVVKMISNFHAFVESRYHISINSSEYWDRVQRISQSAEHVVDQIKSASKIVSDKGVENELDYSRLHMILTTFYNQAK